MEGTKKNVGVFIPKGYKGLISSDYYVLWYLINQGHAVAGWILYTDKYEEPIYDIVEVCVRNGSYKIGVRGKGYEGLEHSKAEFVDICSHYKLSYINPSSEPNFKIIN